MTGADITPEDIANWRGAKGSADLTNSGFDREGNLTLTFTIHPESKYDLLPITDIKGRAFQLTVATASHRVFAGRAGLEAARARVKRVESEEAVGRDYG